MRMSVLLLVPVLLAGCLSAPGLPLLDELQRATGPEPRAQRLVPDGAESATVLTLAIVESEQGPRGIATPVTMAVAADGTGALRIRSEHGVAPDTRGSAQDAARAAAGELQVDPQTLNFTIILGENVGPVSGPSAGSQFALGFYVALTNLLAPHAPMEVRNGYAGTGAISPNGRIGPVGAVPEKAEAASEHGAELFVFPDGPVFADEGPSPRGRLVDMDATCADLDLMCVQVSDLGGLARTGTMPAG